MLAIAPGTKIGNITVLSSSLDLSLLDPSLLAELTRAVSGGSGGVITPGSSSPPPSGSGVGGSSGSGSGSPSGAGSSSDDSSSSSSTNTGVIVGAAVGGVAGVALLAGIVAGIMMRAKKAKAAGYSNGNNVARVTPEQSMTGAVPVISVNGAAGGPSVTTPDRDSPARPSAVMWHTGRSSANGSNSQVAPEPIKKELSPLNKSPGSNTTQQLPVTSLDSPRIFTPRPGSANASPRHNSAAGGASLNGAADPMLPAAPAAAMTAAGGRGPAPAFPRMAPEPWQSAARGRQLLPALRPNSEGEWTVQGHNVMTAGSTHADIPIVGDAPPPMQRLPGAPSVAGPGAAEAARQAVNESKQA